MSVSRMRAGCVCVGVCLHVDKFVFTRVQFSRLLR